MKKENLLETLYSALEREEEANNHFYTYTINSLKYYKWLSEDKKAKIENLMTRLRGDSAKHKNTIEELIQKVQESDKNVF